MEKTEELCIEIDPRNGLIYYDGKLNKAVENKTYGTESCLKICSLSKLCRETCKLTGNNLCWTLNRSINLKINNFNVRLNELYHEYIPSIYEMAYIRNNHNLIFDKIKIL